MRSRRRHHVPCQAARFLTDGTLCTYIGDTRCGATVEIIVHGNKKRVLKDRISKNPVVNKVFAQIKNLETQIDAAKKHLENTLHTNTAPFPVVVVTGAVFHPRLEYGNFKLMLENL